MIRLLLRATNSILEAKPPHILKVVYVTAVFAMIMTLADSGWNFGECATLESVQLAFFLIEK